MKISRYRGLFAVFVCDRNFYFPVPSVSPCENEIKITQGHGEHREMGHGVKDTSCEIARIDEAMAAGGMTVKMISYAKKLRQIYRFYLADNPPVMFATTKQTTNSHWVGVCRLTAIDSRLTVLSSPSSVFSPSVPSGQIEDQQVGQDA